MSFISNIYYERDVMFVLFWFSFSSVQIVAPGCRRLQRKFLDYKTANKFQRQLLQILQAMNEILP